jgi:hypothetical protein
MRPVLTMIVVSLALVACGCFGSSSAGSPRHRPASPVGPATGTVEGGVFTTACGGPAASSCTPETFRGSLVFCRTMSEIGPCPAAHVDTTGHYRIALKSGRYALIPAPGNGNVVVVKPRWVRVVPGRITALNISGGSLMK